MSVNKKGIESSGDDTTCLELLRRDNRGVFGCMELQLPAELRRREKRGEPRLVAARKRMKDQDYDGARDILMDCLPRDANDYADPRYFGVLWSLGEIEQQSQDRSAALQHFIQAITQFPASLRRGHLERLESFGIEMARIRLSNGDSLAETDAAAILQQLIEIQRSLEQEQPVVVSTMREAHRLSQALEVGAPPSRPQNIDTSRGRPRKEKR